MKIPKIISTLRKKGYIPTITLIFFLILAVLGSSYLYWHGKQKPKPFSTSDKSSIPPQASPIVELEKFFRYSSDKFNFTLYAPKGFEISVSPFEKGPILNVMATNQTPISNNSFSPYPKENEIKINLWVMKKDPANNTWGWGSFNTSSDIYEHLSNLKTDENYAVRGDKYFLTDRKDIFGTKFLFYKAGPNVGYQGEHVDSIGAIGIKDNVSYFFHVVRGAKVSDAEVNDYFNQAISSFYVRSNWSVPTLTGNSITVNIRNPFYSPNNEGISLVYTYTFSYDFKTGDIVNPVKNLEEKENLYTGIEIQRNSAKVKITIPFEGVQITYDERPNPIVVDNPNISKKTIYRVKYTPATPYDSPDYLYVSDYLEGTEKCGQSSTPLAACSNSSADTYGISCKANSEMVFHCDDIVKSLKIQSPKLRE